MSNSRINMLETFLKEEPGDPFSIYALALEYAKLNDLQMAISLLEDLRIAQPEYLALYYQLGKFYEHNGISEKAVFTYEEGIRIAQKQGNSHTKMELQMAVAQLNENDDQE